MAKSVKDAMTANPCTIDAGQTVSYAAKMMKDEDVGLAPVVEGQRLVGTLTDRDIVVRVVAEGGDPQTVKVREVASHNLVIVDPQQDLDEALKLMASHQCAGCRWSRTAAWSVCSRRPTSPSTRRRRRPASWSKRSRRAE